MSAHALVRALVAPDTVAALDEAGWTGLLTAARAERLLGTLAMRLDARAAPAGVAALLSDAIEGAEAERRAALWEAEMARRALAPIGVAPILLKGTAFAAAGSTAARGRAIGDLDILVPRAALAAVEAALIGAGWEPVKTDPYDDAYYRRWMHELPPLIHAERDRLIDVHHSILPPTARPRPDAAALCAEAVPLGQGLWALAPADRIVHAAAHLLADGDLSGGLRNLWDIDRLVREQGVAALRDQARRHGLLGPVRQALRLAHRLYETPCPDWAGRFNGFDALVRRRLLVRDGWGRQRHAATRFGFYLRSHALRMPPPLLARHLAIKALPPRWRPAR
ncbi:nucleotidyltransferase family protein [Sphingomonas morindae]|uniref:Nucleotidyltransferase family protein n=1 Tax=Sphingomonas morindae TaxID=1541170 RepID=A0ABY4XBH3_9SPHN|nr:nucleotidyltransferase family protein [Sphingomonas morindae]USI74106.1 nucleotidyltransferase family protein [Sphingomonas morindae]